MDEVTSTGANPLQLRSVLDVLERLYPPGSAADWDAVGLVCGDHEAPVRRVMLAVDPTVEVAEEATAWRADLLVVHHPLLLRGVHSMPLICPKGRVLHQLIKHDCALYVAHTNADVALPGVSDALARVLGLDDLAPLTPQAIEPLDKLVVFVPADQADALVDALSAAGAGSIGEYTRCTWTSAGIGSFIPGADADPALGQIGQLEVVPETRVEMVLPRPLRGAVVRALRAAHPYEEPAFDVLELAEPSRGTGIGRVGMLEAPMTLDNFARVVSKALPFTVQGVRVAGDKDALVQRVAVVGGAGDSQFDAARSSGADVYLTADLRHHPALEARQLAGGGIPYLVDVSHWASEWPWLAGCESRLVAGLGGAGSNVETRISSTRTDPWTMHVPSRGSTP